MIQTGAEWMNQGVPLIFTRKFDSAAVTLDLAEKLYLKD
jgi:hypothetical protein